MQTTTDVSDALQAALASLLGAAATEPTPMPPELQTGGYDPAPGDLQQQVDAAVEKVVGEMTEADFEAIDAAAAAEFMPEPEPAPAPRRYGRRGFRRKNTAHWIKVEAVTITENVAKNGLEIRFPGKPSDTIRDMLKRRGWQFSGTFGCWYHKATDANRTYAREIKALAEKQ